MRRWPSLLHSTPRVPSKAPGRSTAIRQKPIGTALLANLEAGRRCAARHFLLELQPGLRSRRVVGNGPIRASPLGHDPTHGFHPHDTRHTRRF